MSEHYHSLKSETFHETNPLLCEVLSKPALSKHRSQRQSEEAGERESERNGGRREKQFVEIETEKM